MRGLSSSSLRASLVATCGFNCSVACSPTRDRHIPIPAPALQSPCLIQPPQRGWRTSHPEPLSLRVLLTYLPPRPGTPHQPCSRLSPTAFPDITPRSRSASPASSSAPAHLPPHSCFPGFSCSGDLLPSLPCSQSPRVCIIQRKPPALFLKSLVLERLVAELAAIGEVSSALQ